MDLAIVIPTMNRAELLLGQLLFYDSFGLKARVYVGDSSTEVQKVTIRRGLLDLKNIKVQFIDFPTSHMQVQVIIDLIDMVKETYITISGDDDYHVLPQVIRCIDFLKSNPDFVACTGAVAMAETSIVNSTRVIVSTSDYSPRMPILSDDPIERIRLLSKHYYLPLFCICRTRDFVEAFTAESNMKSNIIWAETLPAFKLIAMGKLQILDGLAMIRGTHALRPNYQNGLLATFMNDDWFNSLHVAMDSIKSYLSKKDLPVAKAEKQLREILSEYYTEQIARSFNEQRPQVKFRNRLPAPLRSILKEVYFRFQKDKLNGGSHFPYSKFYDVFSRLSESFKSATRYLN